jgi:hypothetical protein
MGEKTLRGQNSAYSCNGASNHSDVAREINDFYATPSIATKTLVEYLDKNYGIKSGDEKFTLDTTTETENILFNKRINIFNEKYNEIYYI